MIKQTQLTKEGLEALKNEFSQLVSIKRPHLVERLSNARKDGDLAENNDYQNAKEELEFLDGRIAELEEVIANALIVKNTKNGGVDVGTEVTLKMNGKTCIYNIVGEWEADPMTKKISLTSPLGLALNGKKVGDKAEVEAPAGTITYEVVNIK